jgi:hemerythrin superfamily protein
MTAAADSSSSTPAKPDDTSELDVVALLTRQHRHLEQMLDALVEAEADTECQRLFAAAADELAVHVSAEEQVFYPAVSAERTEDILLESLEEHLSLKRLVADLLDMDPNDATWGAKAKVLQEQTEHHHREEEEHLFPKVRALLSEDRRMAVGREVKAHEHDLRARGKPRLLMGERTDSAEPLPEASGAGQATQR